MLTLQNILQNENFDLFLGISVPLFLTVLAFAIFYFGFRKNKKPTEIPQLKVETLETLEGVQTPKAVETVDVKAPPKPKLVTLSDSLSLTRTMPSTLCVFSSSNGISNA